MITLEHLTQINEERARQGHATLTRHQAEAALRRNTTMQRSDSMVTRYLIGLSFSSLYECRQ